ncbi:MAG: type II toxin-antitoxin system VapC family toxin [Planctomycetota bacterium]|nr:type II toxin-antitoxin system VapC family toxin [Planctomycetota bacterium]
MCWEIAIKVGSKKLDLGELATTFLPRELTANMFDLLKIELRHVTFVETLPPYHKDPFDRLLIAQSTIEAIPILSVDVAFDRYGVNRLW